MITEGLIAIGILALLVAIFLLQGKAKTSQTNTQVVQVPKRPTDEQAVPFAEPSVSAATQTQNLFPAPGVPFPVSVVDEHAESLEEATTQTLVPFPVQVMAVAQTPVQESQLLQTHIQDIEADQTHVPIAVHEPSTAKPDESLPETPRPSSLPSRMVSCSSPLTTASRSLSQPPSISQQMTELLADTWELQQQVVDMGRRLNYLSVSIQHLLASSSHEPDANSRD